MNSPARQRLRYQFSQLTIGQKFQLVNTVMGGAVPGTPTYQKIDDEEFNATNTLTDQGVIIRDTAEVELLE